MHTSLKVSQNRKGVWREGEYGGKPKGVGSFGGGAKDRSLEGRYKKLSGNKFKYEWQA